MINADPSIISNSLNNLIPLLPQPTQPDDRVEKDEFASKRSKVFLRSLNPYSNQKSNFLLHLVQKQLLQLQQNINRITQDGIDLFKLIDTKEVVNACKKNLYQIIYANSFNFNPIEPIKSLEQYLTNLCEEKFKALKSSFEGKEKEDPVLCKLIQLAEQQDDYFKAFYKEMAKFCKSSEAIRYLSKLDTTSCGFTSWGIVEICTKIPTSAYLRVRSAGTDLEALKKMLKKGKESLYACILENLFTNDQMKCDAGHEFVIHEKKIDGEFFYRIFCSYVKLYDLKSFLALVYSKFPEKQWISSAKMDQFLDDLSEMIKPMRIWGNDMIKKYQKWFGATLFRVDSMQLIPDHKNATFSIDGFRLSNEKAKVINSYSTYNQALSVAVAILAALTAYLYFSR